MDIHSKKFNEGITATILGIILGINLTLSIIFYIESYKNKIWTITLYFSFLSYFHLAEYLVTAKYNHKKANWDAFLLRNGRAYIIAQVCTIIEAIIEFYYKPWWVLSNSNYSIVNYINNNNNKIIIIGLCFIILGQLLRSLAMAQAGASFSHLITENKREDQVLVTTGVYSFFRHPSYTGYFYWAIGIQLLLLNPFCLLLFVYVLRRFFKRRIEYEENQLIEFFGQDYANYAEKSYVLIP